MNLQDVLVLIQTLICATSLIISLLTLNNTNSIKKIIENNTNIDNKHKNNNKQTAIGNQIRQKM